MALNDYRVTVGNIGEVHQGNNKMCANQCYVAYVQRSKGDVGRAGGEQVTLWKNGEPIREHEGVDRDGLL